MKKFIVLLLLSCNLGFAQAPKVEPVVDTILQASFQHLSERAAAHGKDYQALLEQAGLLSIKVVDSLPNNDMGGYKRTGATFTVEIAFYVTKDPQALEYTIAHELGHGLGLECTDTGKWDPNVMDAYGVIDPTHLLYQLRGHPTYAPEIWANYFNQL